MASLYITEYGGTGSAGGKIEVPVEPPITVQKVTFTGTSAASSAFNANTRFISIQLSANGHVQFAASPTATTSTSRVHDAGAVSFHGVNSSLKVAAITA